eukprot:518874-Pyramimonas_sp.AAC.1
MASGWPQTAQEAPKGPSRRAKSPPRGPPCGSEEAKIADAPCVLEGFWHVFLLGIPTAQNGPRGPQDRPRGLQYGPMMAQGAPKTAPRGPKKTPTRPKWPRRQPRWSQYVSKTAQDAPKMA